MSAARPGDGPDDGCLADAEASNEAAGVDGAEVAVDAANHEDDDSDDPEEAQDAGGVDAADAVADDKGAGAVGGYYLGIHGM